MCVANNQEYDATVPSGNGVGKDAYNLFSELHSSAQFKRTTPRPPLSKGSSTTRASSRAKRALQQFVDKHTKPDPLVGFKPMNPIEIRLRQTLDKMKMAAAKYDW